VSSISDYNKKRWSALAASDSLFTRPVLDLTVDSARRTLDRHDQLPPLQGEQVLCLAGGGGKQSAAFALLGADVTVVDLCEEQLEADRVAARNYGTGVRTLLADMRDLSALATSSFGVVFQPYSINFVPDPVHVFSQVQRVLRTGGTYQLSAANPTALGLSPRDHLDGHYPLRHSYYEPGPVLGHDEPWVFPRADSRSSSVPPPQEFRHTLSTIINGLIASGFSVRHISEHQATGPPGLPGTWEHFTRQIPPWFDITTQAS